VSSLLKNTLDWLSRPEGGQSGLVPYQGKVAAIVGASPGALGGLRGLVHLRQILMTLNVLVLSEQLALSRAHDARGPAAAGFAPLARSPASRGGWSTSRRGSPDPPVLLVELLIGLVGAAIALAWLARHLGLPYPIALVVGGAAIGFVPGLPRLPFDPNLILVLVLPPILYQAALFTSWRDFRANLGSISLLAVGLVIATTVAVAATLKWLVPELPWAVAFAFGAIVSPPDAVAATAIMSRVNVPRRIVTLIEGESLVNDASGLVLYRFAVAAALTGTFSLVAATGQFVLVATGGIVVGTGSPGSSSPSTGGSATR
jgi:hypothetical protein